MENLITQKKLNEELIKDWERKQKAVEDRKHDEEALAKQKKLEMFEMAEFDLNLKAKTPVQNPFNKNPEEDLAKIKEQLQAKGRIDDKEGIIQKNFWVPETKPGLEKQIKEKPANKLICPATKGHDIKLKTLHKVKLDFIDDKCVCITCKKELKFQKIAMPAVCGHVMCRKCLDMGIDGEHMRCTMCDKKYGKAEIVNLKEAWSAFTSHNPVEAKVYTPSFSV